MASKFFYSILLLMLITTESKAIDVSISHACFSLDEAPYVEIYFHFLGTSITNVKEEGKAYEGEVEVTIFFKREGVIIDYDKYNLKSPSSVLAQDFQDIKRYALASGAYDLEIMIQDVNAVDNHYNHKEVLSVPTFTDVAFSEIQFMASVFENEEGTQSPFSKNGIGFEALPFDFLDNKYNELNFYQEIYNTNSLEKECYVSFSIIDENNNELSKGYKKLTKAAINPILQTLVVKEIPSGKYELKVELRDRDKKLLKTSSKSFRRSNPDMDIVYSQNVDSLYRSEFVKKLDKEKLDYHLRALAPILTSDQNSILNAVIGSDNKKSKAYFIYAHFSQYGESNAYKVFEKYSEVADAVHNMFYSGFGYGFESDRGHIYLKYGLPTSKVSIENEPSAPPYEMWVYDVIETTRQKNVKFVFYNPNLVHNDFQLLHSTCRGEKFNVAWEVELYRSDTNVSSRANSDTEEVERKMGRQAREIFEDL